jgi:hypothetical protein
VVLQQLIPVGRIRQFNRELARVTRGQEEFIARALNHKKSMAQQRIKNWFCRSKESSRATRVEQQILEKREDWLGRRERFKSRCV